MEQYKLQCELYFLNLKFIQMILFLLNTEYFIIFYNNFIIMLPNELESSNLRNYFSVVNLEQYIGTDKYDCKICNHLVCEPVLCSGCVSVYCKKCLQNLINSKKVRCPKKCKLKNIKIIALSEEKKKEIDEIFVQCNNGCLLSLSECYNHFQSCIIVKDQLLNDDNPNKTLEDLINEKKLMESQLMNLEFRKSQKLLINDTIAKLQEKLDEDGGPEAVNARYEETKKLFYIKKEMTEKMFESIFGTAVNLPDTPAILEKNHKKTDNMDNEEEENENENQQESLHNNGDAKKAEECNTQNKSEGSEKSHEQLKHKKPGKEDDKDI